MASVSNDDTNYLEYLERIRLCVGHLGPEEISFISNTNYWVEDSHVDAALTILRWRYRHHTDIHLTATVYAASLQSIGSGKNQRNETAITADEQASLASTNYVVIPVSDAYGHIAPNGSNGGLAVGSHWSCIVIDRQDKNKPVARYIDPYLTVTEKNGTSTINVSSSSARVAGEIVHGFERLLGLACGNIKISTLKWTPHQVDDNRSQVDKGACGLYVSEILDYLLSNRDLLDTRLKKSFRKSRRKTHVNNMNFNSIISRKKLQAEIRRVLLQISAFDGESGNDASVEEVRAGSDEDSFEGEIDGENDGHEVSDGMGGSQENASLNYGEVPLGFEDWYSNQKSSFSRSIVELYSKHEPEDFAKLKAEEKRRRVGLIHYRGSQPRKQIRKASEKLPGKAPEAPTEGIPIDPYTKTQYNADGHVDNFSTRTTGNLQLWVNLKPLQDLPDEVDERNRAKVADMLDSCFGRGFDTLNVDIQTDREELLRLRTHLFDTEESGLDAAHAKVELSKLYKERASRLLKDWKLYPVHEERKRDPGRHGQFYPANGMVDDFLHRHDTNILEWLQREPPMPLQYTEHAKDEKKALNKTLQQLRLAEKGMKGEDKDRSMEERRHIQNRAHDQRATELRACLQHFFGRSFRALTCNEDKKHILRWNHQLFGDKGSSHPETARDQLVHDFTDRWFKDGQWASLRGSWNYYPEDKTVETPPIDPYTKQPYPANGEINDFYKRSKENIQDFLNLAPKTDMVSKVKPAKPGSKLGKREHGRRLARLQQHFSKRGLRALKSKTEEEQKFWAKELRLKGLDEEIDDEQLDEHINNLSTAELKELAGKIQEDWRKQSGEKYDEDTGLKLPEHANRQTQWQHYPHEGNQAASQDGYLRVRNLLPSDSGFETSDTVITTGKDTGPAATGSEPRGHGPAEAAPIELEQVTFRGQGRISTPAQEGESVAQSPPDLPEFPSPQFPTFTPINGRIGNKHVRSKGGNLMVNKQAEHSVALPPHDTSANRKRPAGGSPEYQKPPKKMKVNTSHNQDPRSSLRRDNTTLILHLTAQEFTKVHSDVNSIAKGGLGIRSKTSRRDVINYLNKSGMRARDLIPEDSGAFRHIEESSGSDDTDRENA